MDAAMAVEVGFGSNFPYSKLEQDSPDQLVKMMGN